MRLTLAALAIFAFAACSPAEKNEAPAQPADVADANDPAEPQSVAVGEVEETTAGEAKSIEEMRAQSLAAVDQEACAAAGGEVRQEGMLGMYRCVKPYSDAGKECRSGSDCEGKCISTGEAATGEEAAGQCQKDDSPFGCYAEVEGGVVQAALCVD